MAGDVVQLFVTGGYFDDGGDGVIWRVDLAEERVDVFTRWHPPTHLKVSGKGFAGGTLGPDLTLYAAAHAAVVRLDLRTADVTGVLHQPCMNDLHHVTHEAGRLYVANTGLSAVDVFELDGTFRGSHALLPAWANTRRMGGDDPPAPPIDAGWHGNPPGSWPRVAAADGYHDADRQTAPFHQLKVPDYLHVNHVARVGERLIATCFADGTLRDLASFDVIARMPGMFLHDGVVDPCGEPSVWFTAIDGTVLKLDAQTFAEERRLSVFETGHVGWCRGLAVTADHLVVGLTEVRPNRRPRHRWADVDPARSETSVLLLDRADGRLLARVDLTDAARHSKLYSVLPTQETA